MCSCKILRTHGSTRTSVALSFGPLSDHQMDLRNVQYRILHWLTESWSCNRCWYNKWSCWLWKISFGDARLPQESLCRVHTLNQEVHTLSTFLPFLPILTVTWAIPERALWGSILGRTYSNCLSLSCKFCVGLLIHAHLCHDGLQNPTWGSKLL